MTPEQKAAVVGVVAEVEVERYRQHEKWGEQNHPDGTGDDMRTLMAEAAQEACDQAAKNGTITYCHILEEEVAEAFAESDPAKLRAELIQVAAVAVAWAEAIDRRTGG